MRLWATFLLVAAPALQTLADLQQDLRCREIGFSRSVEAQGRERVTSFIDPDARFVGANAIPDLYSLIESAKANGIEPYAYLRTIFTERTRATSVEEIEALLPVTDDSAHFA